MEGLTDGDIWRLDIFEGAEYERCRVRCRLLGEGEGEGDGGGDEEGREVEAETYVWKEEGRELLEMGEWDFEVFRREKMGRWVGGSGEFDGEFGGSF